MRDVGLPGGQRGLRARQLSLREIVVEPLPPERGHRTVKLRGRLAGQAGRHQRARLVDREHRQVAGRAMPVRTRRRREQLQRGGNVAGQQVAVAQVVQRLGHDQIVPAVDGDAPAPVQVGSCPADVAAGKVDEAAVEQGRGQVLGLGPVLRQRGDRVVEQAKRLARPAATQA